MRVALESLPPDQRAVLQLILKQGRGYGELSGLLKIDQEAVRARAHAGLEALVPNGAGAALTPERRAQIADYLLRQQDERARAVTLQHLEDSRAARRWANALRDQLAPLTADELPEIPGPASRNGTSELPALADAPEPVEPAAAQAQAPPPAAPAEWQDAPRRSSKLGGILLLAGIAAVVAVLVIVLVNRGGDDDNPTASAPAAQTQASSGRAASRSSDSGPAAGNGADQPTVIQQVNLNPPGGQASDPARGIAFIMVQDSRPVVAVQVEQIAENGPDDVYAAFLHSSRTGRSRFLGYVPGQVGRDRRFTVSSPLPRDTASYNQVVVSRESTQATTAPGAPSDVVLTGTLKVNRTG